MRGRALLALLAVAALAAGGTALRSVHPRALDRARPAGAFAGSWFCPHGGGPGWRVRLSLANPGTEPISAIVTTMTSGRPGPAHSITLPPRSDTRVIVAASARESSSEVEYFGGWIGAGWLSRAPGSTGGIAAEPCLASLGRSWILPDGTTLRGEDGWAVVMNPAATPAIFQVRLLSGAQPIMPGPWSDFVLAPHRSTALHLNGQKLGATTVSTVIDVKIGRVAAASIGVSASGGIRAAVGVTGSRHDLILPGGRDGGRSGLVVADPGAGRATFGGTLERTDGSQPLGQLRGATLSPGQAQTYDISTTPGSTIHLAVTSPTGMVAARRSFGPNGDEGSTSGAEPARAWIVSSGALLSTGRWTISLANPGTTAADVELWPLSGAGPTPGVSPRSVHIPPGRTALLGPGLTGRDILGAVVAVASSGIFLPMATSVTSNRTGYSVAVGEAIPDRWIPTGTG